MWFCVSPTVFPNFFAKVVVINAHLICAYTQPNSKERSQIFGTKYAIVRDAQILGAHSIVCINLRSRERYNFRRIRSAQYLWLALLSAIAHFDAFFRQTP